MTAIQLFQQFIPIYFLPVFVTSQRFSDKSGHNIPMADLLTAKITHFSCADILILLSECLENYDCPNGGENYICKDNVCECVPGSILLGDSCVGMSSF